MNLEDQNLVGSSPDEKDEHIFACHEMIRVLRKAYLYARSSAAGLTNYCKDFASARCCGNELERAEKIYNQTLETDAQKDGAAELGVIRKRNKEIWKQKLS